MNYPKEFYVTTPIVGDKVWLDVDRFLNGKRAHHGPWWIISVHPNNAVKIQKQDESTAIRGQVAVVLVSQLLRMSKTQIKKMSVLKNPV